MLSCRDDLKKYESHCEERQSKIVSKENKIEHIAVNSDRQIVLQYKVDGEIYTSGDRRRCDYLVMNEEKKTAYLIELKSGKIQKGLEQLFATERDFAKVLEKYQVFLRLVYSSATQNVMRTEVVKARKQHNNLIVKNKKCEEVI